MISFPDFVLFSLSCSYDSFFFYSFLSKLARLIVVRSSATSSSFVLYQLIRTIGCMYMVSSLFIDHSVYPILFIASFFSFSFYLGFGKRGS